ncbi:ATP-binding protein [Paenibacillus sp.]|uniref:ATP-binding protein n=1 Tax=Paenibacillus sp. TaxID=58172 RepID=UPI00281266C5|nr:ATP-binding protein [Paenibacillus sp.]
MEDRLHMELAASLQELGRMGEAVAAFCERGGIDEKLSYAVQLVCDEWVTNVIAHGYGGAPPDAGEAAIELTIERTADSLRLAFVDRAPPFDPLTHPEPDVDLSVDEREVGGLGIHFMKKIMDACEYERIGGRNRLALTKKLGTRREGQDEHHG